MQVLSALVTAVILGSGTAALPTSTVPCSCIDVPLEEHIASTPVVLSGTVIAKDTAKRYYLETPYSSRLQSVLEVRNTVLLKRVFKGDVSDTVIVFTPLDEAACAYTFTVGKAYLIYADVRDGAFCTSICSATKPLANAGADLKLLGELRTKR